MTSLKLKQYSYKLGMKTNNKLLMKPLGIVTP